MPGAGTLVGAAGATGVTTRTDGTGFTAGGAAADGRGKPQLAQKAASSLLL